MDYNKNVIDKVISGFFMMKQHMSRPAEFDLRPILNPANFYLLCMVKGKESLTMSEIAHMMHISKQQATQMTDRMVASGYIKRESGEKDRRIIRIMITSQGEEVLEAGITLIRGKMQEQLSLLPEEDLIRMEQAIDTLMDIMHKINEASALAGVSLKK